MNLLVTGAWQGAKENTEKLEAMGHVVSFLQFENDALPCDYAWVEGVVCNGLFLTHPIERFVNLRFIQLTSAGLDRVPMDYVQAHGIELHSARGVYSIPMAEFAIGGVLQLYKKAAFFADNQRRHAWGKCRDIRELSGKTVCIVGCGSVGNECALRFRAFGCRVIGVSARGRERTFYEIIRPASELYDAVEEADIVVLTLPLTAETRHRIDRECLRHFKPGSVLVNIARGAIVDTAALTDAMETRLFGAVLDVFEEEPLSADSPLWDMEHVILTPHNSFVGEGNPERLAEIILSALSGS